MPRITAKPILQENGYPCAAVVRLCNDAQIKELSDGKKMWTAYAQLERRPKTSNDMRVYTNMFVADGAYNNNLASKLLPWEKGTILFVFGDIILDEYWTERNGKESYKLVPAFVLAQPDYAEAMRQASNTARNYESNTAQQAEHDDFFEDSGYDPGF